jgi:hypothetical protein
LPLYVPQEPLPTEGVSMLIACGPFTSHKDMSFKGLRRVLEEAISRDVSVLILVWTEQRKKKKREPHLISFFFKDWASDRC